MSTNCVSFSFRVLNLRLLPLLYPRLLDLEIDPLNPARAACDLDTTQEGLKTGQKRRGLLHQVKQHEQVEADLLYKYLVC